MLWRAAQPAGLQVQDARRQQGEFDQLPNAAPSAGHTYEAGLYDVEIRETGPHGAPGRKIEHQSLFECSRV
jgi:hypothetical protein